MTMDYIKNSYTITSRRYENKGIVTFIGRGHYYEMVDGVKTPLFSESTGIHRLTVKEAQTDAFKIAFDRFHD